VIAIAVTLLVLPLVDEASSDRASSLRALLDESGGELFVFVLSFVVICRFWLVHHDMFRTLWTLDGRLFWLNALSAAQASLPRRHRRRRRAIEPSRRRRSPGRAVIASGSSKRPTAGSRARPRLGRDVLRSSQRPLLGALVLAPGARSAGSEPSGQSAPTTVALRSDRRRLRPGPTRLATRRPVDRSARLRLVADACGRDRDSRAELLTAIDDAIARIEAAVRRSVAAGGSERFDRRRRWWTDHHDRFAADFL
jgi:hypothetical protein